MNVNMVHQVNAKLKGPQKSIKLFNFRLLLSNFPATPVSLLSPVKALKTLGQAFSPDSAAIVYV